MAARPNLWDEPLPIFHRAVRAAVLAVASGVVLFPLWMILVTSLSPDDVINQTGGAVVVPRGFSFAAYEQLFAGSVVPRSLAVSALITIVGTTISVVATILAAYALSDSSVPLVRFFLAFIVITMFFSAGIIPNYLLMSSLGLLDSLWALILPPAVSAFNVIIMRAFFQGIASDIIDAARIDGAGHWKIVWSIVVPLARPVIAVVALFSAMGFWNAFFNAMLYLQDNGKWPLQLVLRSFVLQGEATSNASAVPDSDVGIVSSIATRMAVLVVSILPAVVALPFLQRYFKSGLMLGAVKG